MLRQVQRRHRSEPGPHLAGHCLDDLEGVAYVFAKRAIHASNQCCGGAADVLANETMAFASSPEIDVLHEAREPH